MPPSVHRRDTAALLAVALRRGEASVAALAALARGETLDEGDLERLKRAGLLQGERLPPRLIVPVLALEASLGLAGPALLEQLLGLLKGANDRSARETLLLALIDQLHEEAVRLAESQPATVDLGQLHAVLDDLALTTERLRGEDVDPALVTRVAVLVAKLVEQLAEAVTLPRRQRQHKPLAAFPPELLALAVDDLVLTFPKLLAVPSVEDMISAFAGDSVLPAAPAPRPLELNASERVTRGRAVQAALSSAEPTRALYEGLDLGEALRRHTRLIGLGRDALVTATLLPAADRHDGPKPLAWSTALVSSAEQAQPRRRPAERPVRVEAA